MQRHKTEGKKKQKTKHCYVYISGGGKEGRKN